MASKKTSTKAAKRKGGVAQPRRGVHKQEGPYGEAAVRRGPQATGKPLLDDWGKGDKH